MLNFFLAYELFRVLSKVRMRRPRNVIHNAAVEPIPDLPPDDADEEAVVSGVTVTVPRAATPPPGPSGTKRHATDDELTPIKAPKRRRRDVRPKRQAAKDAEELIKVHLAEIRIGKRLWIRSRRHAPPRVDRPHVDDGSDDEAEGVYEVEKILDERVDSSGDKSYLVKWARYETPTWEPAENLVDCRGSFEEFEASYDAGYDDRSVIDSDSD